MAIAQQRELAISLQINRCHDCRYESLAAPTAKSSPHLSSRETEKRRRRKSSEFRLRLLVSTCGIVYE